MKLLKGACFLAVMGLIAFTELASAHEEWPDTTHTYLAEGLKQFSYRFQLTGNHHLATLRGWGQNECPQLHTGRVCVRFDLVTHEGKNTEITVILPESEAHRVIFIHEISPDIGKYRFWNPVLLLPIYYDQVFAPEFPTIYQSHEIDLIGRFYVHGAAKSAEKDHYHFESYPIDRH